MTTPLKRLFDASTDVLPLVRTLAGPKCDEFIAALAAAAVELDAQTSGKIRATIDKSWDLGWEINEYEALMALAVVIEFPGRKIQMIKSFRTRTDDGRGYGLRDSGVNLLKRAKEVIEVAQGVLN